MEPEAPCAKMSGAVGSREVVSSEAAEKEEMEMGLETLEGLGMVWSWRFDRAGEDIVRSMGEVVEVVGQWTELGLDRVGIKATRPTVVIAPVEIVGCRLQAAKVNDFCSRSLTTTGARSVEMTFENPLAGY